MSELLRRCAVWAFGIVTGIFMFLPESFFDNCDWITQEALERYKLFSCLNSDDVNVFFSRVICFIIVCFLTLIVYAIYLKFNRRIMISGENYLIQVEYGDIIKNAKNCKRVINFDECFTTQVGGTKTADINPTSICGQYLTAHPNLDIQQLLDDAKIKPARSKSRYQQKTRYESGTIVPNGDDLLMAFAKLDERGKGRFFSRDEYLQCLELLWIELENYYSEKDVCVPILGAGTTAFDGGEGASLSQQELLDIMVWSYKLSSHKIKAPHKLRIICRRNKDFSINSIDK